MTVIDPFHHPHRGLALALAAVSLAACGTTEEDRARLRESLRPTPTAAAPVRDAISARTAAAVAETTRLRVGTAPVTAVAFTPDGAAILTGDEEGVVRRGTATIGDDGEPIRAITATGEKIAWGGDAGVIRALGGGAARDVARAERGISSLASTLAGTLAAGTGQGRVLVFGRARYELDLLERAVSGLAFASDGRRLAAISRTGDGIIVERTRELARFGHRDGERGGEMHAVAWIDPLRIGTVSEDGALRLFTAGDGARVTRLGVSRRPLRALAVSVPGSVVATGGDDGRVVLVQGDGRRLGRVRVGAPVLDLAFSPDGARLAVACADGTVRVLSVRG